MTTAIVSSHFQQQQSDSMIFSVFLTVALHSLLIFGISFAAEKAPELAPTLEVTLTHNPSGDSPDEADFLAAQNQLGSGTADRSSELTTDRRADFADTRTRDISPQAQAEMRIKNTQQEQPVVVALTNDGQATPDHEEKQEQQEGKHDRDQEKASLSEEIASLRARLDKQRQDYAKKPRIRTITSVSAKQADDAAYFLRWRETVETIGNRYYPEEARRQQLFGDVRLLVSLKPNGTIYEARVLQSSGHNILDNAALQIVHRAAPFAPFPPKIKKEVDRLEIIRTWRFEHGSLSTQS
ncbi:MAG: energy transducer TonB [Cellvibrionaceae bacterium]